VWVGFDSVILPGVTIGRGSIIGSKTIVEEDVPAYSIVVGNPARLVRRLEPDDTESARADAFGSICARGRVREREGTLINETSSNRRSWIYRARTAWRFACITCSTSWA